jgi:hypothetical protein
MSCFASADSKIEKSVGFFHVPGSACDIFVRSFVCVLPAGGLTRSSVEKTATNLVSLSHYRLQAVETAMANSSALKQALNLALQEA